MHNPFGYSVLKGLLKTKWICVNEFVSLPHNLLGTIRDMDNDCKIWMSETKTILIDNGRV